MEMGQLRTEFGELRSEVKAEIGELRAEVKAEIGELKTEIADSRSESKTNTLSSKVEFKSDMARIHEAIATQTRWLLVLGIGLVTIYPILNRVVTRLIP
ncbi:MAG: hypothetical protein K8R21_09120 [Leptospira sp.]|nr:hypothetical protein [Leptospira sp.]